ncbi:MAG TPA: glutamate 5-kinase [Tepidisphaeraceae bacterium]|nr:glutamate 5-kinase [Tepidisphaeraceae bacterium]
MESPRKQYLGAVRTAVIKLGTQVLSDPQGRLDAAFLESIALQVMQLQARGMRVTLVSSGAIGAGLRQLNLSKRPTDLGRLQAVAAVGQRRLMDAWAAAFAPHKRVVAQILLTREDIDDRTRYLNLRNTIVAVHELGGVPIINENDTISTDELVRISFGDNDILAALVARALRADLLVLLSSVDGILDADGKPVRLVDKLDEVRELVRAEKSALGKGGFNSKLEAARLVAEAGEAMIVADGRSENVLPRLVEGHELGTLFVPASRKLSSRSRWIGSARPAGDIYVDDGAVKALVEKNKSLLPAGIVKVEGQFAPGDVVAICSTDGSVIARGLSNYSAADVERIRGKKTADVRTLLADATYDEVIHRDNLVVK